MGVIFIVIEGNDIIYIYLEIWRVDASGIPRTRIPPPANSLISQTFQIINQNFLDFSI